MEQLLFILILLLKGFTLYFAVVALFALGHPDTYPEAAPRIRFAVLAAARNEEQVIGTLVESILSQHYPEELRDMYVIPNHCTDFTEAAAAAAGAKIIHCDESVTCKGDALHCAVEQLMDQGYDAFVIFDADNRVDPQFLQRINDAMAAGVQVCKGRQRVKNPGDSGTAGSYGLYFTAFDLFFNRPRAACGLSAKLVGTGFAVRREVLERLGGWHTTTLAEDAEFAAQCARLGERVCWVPNAVTYDEAPAEFALSLRQRRRWCSGVMEVARQELGRLWSEPVKAPGRRWDLTMFLLAPFAQAISAMLVALWLVVTGSVLWAGISLLLGYGAMTLAALLLSYAGGYCPWGRTILVFPLFMASWLPLQILSLFSATRQWHPIAHTGGKSAALPRRVSPLPAWGKGLLSR